MDSLYRIPDHIAVGCKRRECEEVTFFSIFYYSKCAFGGFGLQVRRYKQCEEVTFGSV